MCKCEAPPRLSLGRHAIALHEQRLSALSLLVVSDDYVDVGSRGFRWGAVGEVLGCRWGYACGRATGCVMCESRHVKRSQSVCSLYVRANDRERAHVNEGLALASWHLGGYGFSSSRSVLLFGLRMTIKIKKCVLLLSTYSTVYCHQIPSHTHAQTFFHSTSKQKFPSSQTIVQQTALCVVSGDGSSRTSDPHNGPRLLSRGRGVLDKQGGSLLVSKTVTSALVQHLSCYFLL